MPPVNPPRSADEIAGLYRDRQARLAERHARMRAVSDVYGGRTQLPLPEIADLDSAAVPNLVQLGTDQMARRAASVLPNLYYPPDRPGFDVHERTADVRRMVNYGWWERTRMKKVTRQRSAWLITYACGPVVVRPDPKNRVPCWEPHHPLDVFPARQFLGSYTPEDVILRHRRDLRWLAARYPEQAARIRKSPDAGPDAMFDVVEYIDGQEVVFVLVGHEEDRDSDMPGMAGDFYGSSGSPQAELVRRPNRAGVCWGVIPERPSLDAPVGHFDNTLGMYKTQAALMALEVHAVRRSIWPDPWLENPNGPMQPHIARRPNRATGEPGVVVNGRLTTVQMDPSFRSVNTMDRLEHAQRQTAGMPAELGGASQSNVRTGARGRQILAQSIDWTIGEVQDALAEALHEENLRAIAIDKGYFDQKKSIHVSWKGSRGEVEYRPSETFANDQHVVEYPIAGTDLSDLVINGGQRVGMGTMSKMSFMDIDPLVRDVEAEIQRLRSEGVEAAFFASVQQLVSMPEGPLQPNHIAEFMQRIRRGEPWEEAYLEIHRALQEAQAQGAPEGAPETQPGLAMPGQGSEIPTVGEPAPSMGNLTSLLSQLGVADQAIRMR